MKSKLIVKNFGAIKSASLDLRSVNVIIGPKLVERVLLQNYIQFAIHQNYIIIQ